MSERDDKGFLSGWWVESLRKRDRLRRHAASLGLLGASVGLGACATLQPMPEDTELAQDRDQLALNVDTLDLQRSHGWAVGLDQAELELPSATPVDVDGSARWQQLLEVLTQALAPGRAALMPYYVPTLFQSLIGPGAASLRAQIRPIHTPFMDTAFGRGRAILSLFAQVGFPTDTILVVDLPGPEAVAVAAAMATRFEPVFAFGNWPHPLGVVPAHETLAASLFYAPLFERARAQRAPGAPALIVLDSNRLLPYEDANEQFDNRYLAKVPTAEGLRALGATHLLYVTPDGEHPEELADLNEAFVELAQAGIDVRSFGMSELERSREAPPLASAGEQLAAADPTNDPEMDEETPGDGDFDDEGGIWAAAGFGWYWYFGGSPGRHCHFWDLYGWHHPRPGVARLPAPSGLGMRLPHANVYRPVRRETIFSGGQMRVANATTAYRPSGFGSVLVHTSRANGHLTGVMAGRSGSFGGSSHGGGQGSYGGGRASYGGGHASWGGGHGSYVGGRSGSFGRASGSIGG